MRVLYTNYYGQDASVSFSLILHFKDKNAITSQKFTEFMNYIWWTDLIIKLGGSRDIVCKTVFKIHHHSHKKYNFKSQSFQ